MRWRNSSEARASGSYPAGHRFKSHFRHHIRPVGQAVKTRPFHGCNMGSIPVRVTNTNKNRTLSGVRFLFVNEAHLRCIKTLLLMKSASPNEVASLICLCASLHTSKVSASLLRSNCFILAKPILH